MQSGKYCLSECPEFIYQVKPAASPWRWGKKLVYCSVESDCEGGGGPEMARFLHVRQPIHSLSVQGDKNKMER